MASKYLNKAESAKSNDDLEICYDVWAGTYDRDVFEFGYHRVLSAMSGLIGRYVIPGSKKVLDAGAGTGILGESLSLLGYKDLTGIDMSENMLEIAEKKKVYKSLQKMVIGNHMDFCENMFYAVLSMGVFTAGCHIPPSSYDEFIRITKPGGHIIFSIRREISGYKDYKQKQDALEQDGKWRLMEKTGPFKSLPQKSGEAIVEISVFEVL
jgi:predicted TPR repeat methyltransferase